jgi:ribosome-associated protein
MINALMKTAVEKAHQAYGCSARIEGMPQDGWMLADFGDVILHIFAPEQRKFYQIEDVWRDAKVLLRVQ